jgi:tyrosyl-tRNA synthetase
VPHLGVDEQLRVIAANAVDVISEADLTRKLERGTPLRVKLGIDPTASDIHLGFAVVLRKLREFQDLGHLAVLILGDFTAQVGDPSGKSVTRPRLTPEEVDANAATYLEQVMKVLSPERLEVRRNSEWLATMGIEDVLRLTARTTVAQMLERDDFANRYRDGKPISIMEFLYPLLQGWDSVMVEADVELGGTDQLFNNLMGRTLQEQSGLEGQVVITMPLLVGLDGTQKMSKSLNNAVGITDAPPEQFGKVMSVPDELMPQYFALATGWPSDKAESSVKELATGSLAPVDAKRLLARTVVDLYHGEGAGAAAEDEFDVVFKTKGAPSDVAEHELDASEAVDGRIRLANVLRQSGLVKSNAEGRRQIEQGGVRLNDVKVEDPDVSFTPAELDGALLQVGRRRWVRISST